MTNVSYQVTVIVPIYNAQSYLLPCMDSLRLQSLRPIEVLLIDNGSPDNSAGCAEQYIAKHDLSRDWHIIHTGENRGPGAARNIGLDRAQGEYVAFVDGDDWIEQDMLMYLYNAALQAECAPCDMSSAAARKEYTDHPGEVMLNPPVGTGVLTKEKRIFLLKHFASNFTTMIYRRAWLEEQGIRFPETFSSEDSAFVGMCYLTAISLAQCDIPFYHYRIHQASVSHRKDSSRMRHKRNAMRQMIDFARDKGLMHDYAGVLRWVYIKKAILVPLLSSR